MKYRIKIEEQIQSQEKKYPEYIELYEQVVEDIDIAELVKIINTKKV